MSHSIPTAKQLADEVSEYALDIIELILLAGWCFALGMWIGMEIAWRMTFAIDSAVLGDMPAYALFSAFFLFVAMGAVNLYSQQLSG